MVEKMGDREGHGTSSLWGTRNTSRKSLPDEPTPPELEEVALSVHVLLLILGDGC